MSSCPENDRGFFPIRREDARVSLPANVRAPWAKIPLRTPREDEGRNEILAFAQASNEPNESV